ncbi:MAG: PEGA domain-containing protein [Myxococcales bacterium]|nr:PEGA domain-containing protein [Myxococcales bacterium]
MLPLRRRFARLCVLAALSGAAAISHAPSAEAQPKPAQPKSAAAAKAEEKAKREEAKKAYGDASKAFDEGKFDEALPLFVKADELYPGAAPKHKIAICHDKLGHTDEAIAAYQTFIDSNPGDKYADRLTEAEGRIKELKASLPSKVVLTLAPEGLAAPQITVDGNPATPVGDAGNELELTAGEHTIVVSAEGYQPVTEVVTLEGGQKLDLALTLAPVAVAPEPEPPPVETPPLAPEETSGGSSNIPAYVTLGIAGAGAILGTIFGIQALGKKGDFDDNPTVENADDAERAALIADMSFGVALTFGITGAVLLFSGGDDTPEEETTARPVIVPYGGPKGGGVAATWKF